MTTENVGFIYQVIHHACLDERWWQKCKPPITNMYGLECSDYSLIAFTAMAIFPTTTLSALHDSDNKQGQSHKKLLIKPEISWSIF